MECLFIDCQFITIVIALFGYCLSIIAEEESVQIFVVDFQGKSYGVDVLGSDTIAEIKGLIRAKTGIKKFRLVFGGKQLDDAETIESYGIEKSAKLEMLGWLKGGGNDKVYNGSIFSPQNITDRGDPAK